MGPASGALYCCSCCQHSGQRLKGLKDCYSILGPSSYAYLAFWEVHLYKYYSSFVGSGNQDTLAYDSD